MKTKKSKFQKLLEPAYIGKVRTRNRMIKTGAGTSFIEKNGYVGAAIKDFYEAIARGGVGLIIVESCGVEYPLGVHHIPVHLHLEDDRYIQSYSELTEVIHKYSCPAFLQFFHSGPWHPKSVTGLTPVSSSALSQKEQEELHISEVKELTVPEIEGLVEKFTRAVERAQKAGFDGAEINANSSHLINTFLSRVWNKRQDKYGCGDLKSRSRFLVEIIQETRRCVGQGFGISVLITAAEYGIDKGITSHEAQEFARIIQEAGADAIQARAYGYHDYRILHPGPERILYPEPPESLIRELDWSRQGAGAFVPLAETIKKAVSIPVITVGRLDPELGEKILEQGKADFIGLHRRLLADPELPNKVAEGRLEDITPCTACYYCWHERSNGRYVRCRLNASLGREREYAIKPAKKKKKVLVVGGGPAGMEAARVAAQRGHEVILYDKEHRLGGLLPLAGLVKGFDIEDMMSIVRYLSTQITKSGVKVNLGKEVNLAIIEELKPDAVILATGGTNQVPEIPGINNRHVIPISKLHRQLKVFLRFLGPRFLRRLTRFWMPVGRNVVIIGGGIQGCQLAEFLVTRHRKVTIVDTAKAIGEGVIPSDTRERLLNWLADKGVDMISDVRYEAVTDKGLTIIQDGTRRVIEADNIIPALPLLASTDLFSQLQDKFPEVYQAGDCLEPRLTADAIADGARLGHTI
jgi:2,4-dienoyl-CoA reductase (NADPH2)